MNATDEKRQLRALLYRPVIHPGWLRPRVHPNWTPPRKRRVNYGHDARHALTVEQVRAIRGRFQPWSREHGAPALAAVYGISVRSINNVLSGATYRDVA